VCAAGTAIAEGASCGTDKICRSNVCVSSLCGDTVVAAGEECDDGNLIEGDGCDATCRFSCLSSDVTRNCTPADECAGQGTCNDVTHICAAGTPLPDDTACAVGPNNFCRAGVCTAPMCGNAMIERGEDCEGGEGCKADCKFLCVNDPATECAGTETPAACQKFACTPTHTCEIVTDPALSGSSCNPDIPADVCVAGVCGPPGCGDATLGIGEDCDDGDQINLDGCDSACKFEMAQRITSLQQQFTTDAFCPHNALGAAITPIAEKTIQGTWDQPVTDGSLSIVFKFLGLQDLTGGDTPFRLGFVKALAAGRVLAASPECGNGVCEESPFPGSSEFGGTNPSDLACPLDCTYDGNNDLDWWYVRDPASVDANEDPLEQLSGQIAAGRLTAGPGTVNLNLLFALQPALVKLFDTKVEALVDGLVTAPTVSTTGTPPGHLASEHLSPALTSVQGSSTGAMCSNVSAESLFNTPMPIALLFTCTDATGQVAAFTPDNHLLDVFVAGCLVFGTPGISPTQPDGSRDGATYHFAFDSETLAVTSCTKDAQPALLTDCVNNATYSSFFKFAADRVIIKRN
jgi:cysteine-rich repeat protein